MRGYLSALVCGALGLLTALLVTSATATGPVTIQDLPGLGYALSARGELTGRIVCTNYWVIGGNGAPETLLGILLDTNHPECVPTSADVMQQRIDRLVAAYPPIPTTTSAPVAPTVTLSATATVMTTITLTSTTASTVTVAAPTMTVTLPVAYPVTVTVAAPAIAPVTVTVPGPVTTVRLKTTVKRPVAKPKKKAKRQIRMRAICCGGQ